MRIELNPAAESAYYLLRAIGGTIYVVGGAVRNTLMGIEPKDIDLLVTNVPASMLDNSRHFFKTGDSFGVYRHRYGDSEVEVALPRTEVSTGPLHTDFDVVVDHNLSIYEDLRRRDFTCNAMAVNIGTTELIDPHRGEVDTLGGIIRSMGSQTFMEDPLRILRAYVLIARFDMTMTIYTASLITQMNASIQNLPAERIQAELDKIFEAPHVATAIQDMMVDGVLDYVLPEVANNWDYDQNNPHHQRLLGPHLLSTLRLVAEESDDPDLRMAALLHDIGKPRSAWVDPTTGSNHFYLKVVGSEEIDKWGLEYGDPLIGQTLGENHEEVGSRMAAARLLHLKYPTNRINRIARLIDAHMWAPFTSERGARRFLNKYGDLADDLLILRYGDNGGKKGYHYQTPGITLDKQAALIQTVRDKGEATKTADLAVNGHDLMAAGLEPGPELGKTLEVLTELVIDSPGLNNRKDLISFAIGYYGGL